MGEFTSNRQKQTVACSGFGRYVWAYKAEYVRLRFIEIEIKGYLDSGCQLCPEGQFSSEPGSTVCIDCLTGSYTDNLGTSVCTNCAAGKYQQDSGSTVCHNCAAGTVSFVLGASACSNCAVGQKQASAGQAVCDLCEAGTYQGSTASTNCLLCPLGKYNWDTGQSTCLDCWEGTWSFIMGSTTCEYCYANMVSLSTGEQGCPLGYYQLSCGPDTYSQDMCLSCTSTNFLTDRSACTLACKPGFYIAAGAGYCPSCPDGEWYGCLTCPAGKYSPSLTSITPSVSTVIPEGCIDCPAGTYQLMTGASFCFNCPLGFTSSNGVTPCSACRIGTYQPTNDGGLCLPCPSGRSSGIAAHCCDGYVWVSNGVCKPCPAGTYQDGNQCIACGPNRWNRAAFAVSDPDRCACAPGYYLSGSSCVACGPNTFKQDASTRGPIVTAMGSCTATAVAVGSKIVIQGGTDSSFSTCAVEIETHSNILLYASSFTAAFLETLEVLGSECNDCLTCESFYTLYSHTGSGSWSYSITMNLIDAQCFRIIGRNPSGQISPWTIDMLMGSVCNPCLDNTVSPAATTDPALCSCNAGYTTGSTSFRDVMQGTSNTLRNILQVRMGSGMCGTLNLVGGFLSFGFTDALVYSIGLPVHDSLMLRVGVVFIDLWSGQKLHILTNNNLRVTYVMYTGMDANLCGDPAIGDREVFFSISIDDSHSVLNLTLVLDQTSGSGRTDRLWWGVSEISIHVSHLTCTACSPGTFKTLIGSGVCSLCPNGMTSPLASTLSSDCICMAGHSFIASMCQPCLQHFYDIGGACVPCPQGTENALIGQTSCVPCGNGFFKQLAVPMACIPCPQGYTTNGTGAAECFSIIQSTLNSLLLPPSCPAMQRASRGGSGQHNLCTQPLLFWDALGDTHQYGVANSPVSTTFNTGSAMLVWNSIFFVFETSGTELTRTNLTTGTKSSVAGSSTLGTQDGTGAAARFQGVFYMDIAPDGTRIVALQTGLAGIRSVVPSTRVVSTYTLSFIPTAITVLSDGAHVWVLSSTELFLVALYETASEYKMPLRYEAVDFLLSTPIGVIALGTQAGVVVVQNDGTVFELNAMSESVKEVATLSPPGSFAVDTTRNHLVLYSAIPSGSGGTVRFSALQLGFCRPCPDGYVSQPGSESSMDCYTPSCVVEDAYPIRMEIDSQPVLDSSGIQMGVFFFYPYCRCKPGFVGNAQDGCVSCPTNTYSTGKSDLPMDMTFCTPCPLGSYSPEMSISVAACIFPSCKVTGSVSTSIVLFDDATGKAYLSCVCPAGFIGSPDKGVACQPCSPGTYADSILNQCRPCADNSTSFAAAATCYCLVNYIPFPVPPSDESLPVVYTGLITGDGSDRCVLRSDLVLGSYYICNQLCFLLPSAECTGPAEYLASYGTLTCSCIDGYRRVDGECVPEMAECPEGYSTIAINETHIICKCPDNTSTYYREQPCTASFTIQQPCPRALVSGPGFFNLDQCKCRDGYVEVEGDCVPCPEDTYQIGNQCVQCSSDQIAPNASTFCRCKLGFESLGEGCTACPIGFFRQLTTELLCSRCPELTTTLQTQSVSIDQCVCNPGYSLAPTSTSSVPRCTACPAGTYQNGTNGPCITCPYNSFSFPASSSVFACACFKGFLNSMSECTECAASYYFDGAACSECPTGSTSVAQSKGVESCLCDRGYSGTFGSNCVQCSPGAYKDFVGSDDCTACPPLSRSLVHGAKDVSQCFCVEGHEGTGGDVCSPCRLGFYKPVVAAERCLPCPSNSNTSTTGATSISACACYPGFLPRLGAASLICDPCEVGKYGESCQSCPANSDTLDRGTRDITGCLCNPGYEPDEELTTCVPCPPNTYKGYIGNDTCAVCPQASVTASPGANSVSDCLCNVSTNSTTGSTPCFPCPADTYSDSIGSVVCTPCPDLTTGPNGSASITNCVARPGYFMSSTTPPGRRLLSSNGLYFIVECPEGTYSDVAGLLACKSCPILMSSPAAADSVALCYCPVGYYGANGGICVPCDVGFFMDRAGSTSCLRCPFNYITESIGSTSIEDCTCPEGYYQDMSAPGVIVFGRPLERICRACDFGTYKEEPGPQECSDCDSYKTTRRQGSVSRFNCSCASGFYDTGNRSCVACPVSTVSSLNLFGSCSFCPANMIKLQNQTDGVEYCACDRGYEMTGGICSACVAGKYKDMYGDDPCLPCPTGATSFVASISRSQCTCVGLGVEIDGMCVVCPAQPVQCPVNRTSLPGAATIHQCVCKPGMRETSDGTCVTCDGQINSCPLGMTSSPQSTSINDCVCKQNYFKNGRDPGTGNWICSPCPGNSYSALNSTSCVCMQGTFDGNFSTCVMCGPGFVYSLNTSTCQDVNECLDASLCPANSTCINTYGRYKCTCPVGYYDMSVGCAPCPPGMSSPLGSTNLTDCYCPLGFSPNADYESCEPCAAGTYYSERYKDCIPCSTHSASSEDARKCVCDDGYVGFFEVSVSFGAVQIDTEDCSLTVISATTVVYPGIIQGGACYLRFLQLTVSSGVLLNVIGSGIPLAIHSDYPLLIGTPIDLSGLGYSGGQAGAAGNGPGGGTAASPCWYGGSGGSHGGYGGDGSFSAPNPVGNVDVLSEVTGDITTNGVNSGSYQSENALRVGGAAAVGTISANGGSADVSNRQGGGGSGGRIAILGGYVSFPARYGTVYYDEYLDPTFLPAMACKVCAAGSYLDAGVCRACPDGSTSLLGSNSLSSCICEKGYTLQGASCSQCITGTFKNTSGNVPCDACAAGASTAFQGSVYRWDCACPPGSYGDGVSLCTPCPAGEYNPYSNQTACLTCPVPTTTLSEGTTGIAGCVCPKGYSRLANGLCSPCSPGTYKDTAGNEACALCPVGRDSDVFGGDSVDSCYCLPGYTSANCDPCGVGFYKTTTGPGLCTACPAGYFQPAEVAVSPTRCLPCSLGFYSDIVGSGSPCTACRTNTFSDQLASTSCTPCHGNSSSSLATISRSRCLCNPGYFPDVPGSCAPCPPGTFKSGLGNFACEPCSAGSYSEAAASLACTACPPQSWVESGATSRSLCHCLPGYTPTNGSCQACAAGSYKRLISNDACVFCPEDKYLPITGATNASQCFPCPPNSVSPKGSSVISDCICNGGFQRVQDSCLECGAGQYSPVPGQCVKCPPDTFTSISIASSVVSCEPCPLNTFSPEGSSSVSFCTCLPGFTASTDGIACSPCPAGTYKSLPGPLQCIPCVQGTYSSALNSSSQQLCRSCRAQSTTLTSGSPDPDSCLCLPGFEPDGFGACQPCQVGFYKPSIASAACSACLANTFNADRGSTSLESCKPCANFSVSDPGSTSCTCIAGFYRSYSTEVSFCVPCPNGTFYNASGMCEDCPLGSYTDVPNQTEACTPCPVNSYTLQTRSNSSLLCYCEPGYARVSKTECRACAPGSFRPDSSAPGKPCNICPINTYLPETASLGPCIRCMNHTTTLGLTGRSSARDCVCNPGYYGSGDASCDDCPAGSYCPGGIHAFPCQFGSSSPTLSTNASACVCIPGYYNRNGVCLICPPNHFCAGGDSILPCANNSFSSEGSVSSDNCTCRLGYLQSFVVCPSGYYRVGTDECTPCPVGTESVTGCGCLEGYVPVPGGCVVCQNAIRVVACPAPFPFSPAGSTSVSQCTASSF
ncbi:hypothetical protein GUITHDRAFT_118978 [Guillardia theta CCMP2712]|uniref:EGF-like domain-containing protein n=1 Tax=Guillardia theta (strain CCMP2712) TaxID=905079 RepID=L1IFY6_GUITC|nr:hypothetical protein GUITHDRAFT_118978 [Guillardia theta CCMP2712]EKX34804.1 hypothetical protein GUITHDRAFT_118978 [Guillardia theta CCMP2712]|eukprot:XP_005821784.1 hypothetical protein GUITHDRAFT_118978 [Guillardia theta CCMP2712]